MSLLLLSQCKQHFEMFKNTMKQVSIFTCSIGKVTHAIKSAMPFESLWDLVMRKLMGLHDPPSTYLVHTPIPHASSFPKWLDSFIFSCQAKCVPSAYTFICISIWEHSYNLQSTFMITQKCFYSEIVISKCNCSFTVTVTVYTEWIKFRDV